MSGEGTDIAVPRVGRVMVPNYPQRGHNKQVVFTQEADFRFYLSTLQDFKRTRA